MNPHSRDTPPDVEEILLEGYRRMTPQQKLRRVGELQQLAESLAAGRIRAQYGADVSERELRLRRAALRRDRETMIKAFGWDPAVEGY